MRLGTIARGESEIADAYDDVVLATSAVVAEAIEATRDAGTFLLVRRERLMHAAEDAIAAARAEDTGELRRQLRRFSSLASAIWTVHDDFHGVRPRSYAP